MNVIGQSYFAIVVFELGLSDGSGRFYREDFYAVRADDLASAISKVGQRAREQEYAAGAGEDRSWVRLAHVVDVAPTLQDSAEDFADLYSRHFASLDSYSKVEIKLGGRDPLAT
jgi:hypothetical protein